MIVLLRNLQLVLVQANILGVIVAAAVIILAVYMLVRPYKEATALTTQVKVK